MRAGPRQQLGDVGTMHPHPSFKNALSHRTAWVRDGMEPVQRFLDKAVPKGSKYLNIRGSQTWCPGVHPPRCTAIPTTVLRYPAQNNVSYEVGSREGMEEVLPCHRWYLCWCSHPGNGLSQVSFMHKRCFSLSAEWRTW